jgi:ABC-2 type transport system ATP-binding protein
MEQVIIRAEGLSRRFGNFTAVDRLDMQVHIGEVFGLVGPDGAGKTTTLRLLAGLLAPTEGRALIAGHDTARHSDFVKDQIGYMAQRFGLYGDLTVQENMDFFADLFGVSRLERKSLRPSLLRMARLEAFCGKRAGQLSGGMKQKLALVCTLLHRPRILLLDEPTTGVDPLSRRDFWEILRQLSSQGVTVVITTSYLDEAERCDRVGLMHRGRLTTCDSPALIRDRLQKHCYALRCADYRKARDLLRTLDGVASVTPAGAELHLFIDSATCTPDEIERQLNLIGLGPVELRRVVPSLEDAFILLMEEASGDLP